MIVVDKVQVGVLYRVDDLDENKAPSIEYEELLTPVEIVKGIASSRIKWLWLTGPDAGTSFMGGSVTYNQLVAVTPVLDDEP